MQEELKKWGMDAGKEQDLISQGLSKISMQKTIIGIAANLSQFDFGFWVALYILPKQGVEP